MRGFGPRLKLYRGYNFALFFLVKVKIKKGSNIKESDLESSHIKMKNKTKSRTKTNKQKECIQRILQEKDLRRVGVC